MFYRLIVFNSPGKQLQLIDQHPDDMDFILTENTYQLMHKSWKERENYILTSTNISRKHPLRGYFLGVFEANLCLCKGRGVA